MVVARLRSGLGTDHDNATTLKALLRQRHNQTYPTFKRLYEKTAKTIDSTLTQTCPTKRQYYRWLNGELSGLPHPGARSVLEAMFPGYSTQQLFEPFEEHLSKDADSRSPVQRRDFLASSFALGVSAILPDVSDGPMESQCGGGVDPAVIGHMITMRDALVSSDSIL
ncbi:MAG TPA: hypothetical protein VFX16_00995, partial [Pseudonocardiaceae bacterium]|nr:hypothetical protein [Pseudonocardiaceae bacterium]